MKDEKVPVPVGLLSGVFTECQPRQIVASCAKSSGCSGLRGICGSGYFGVDCDTVMLIPANFRVNGVGWCGKLMLERGDGGGTLFGAGILLTPTLIL